MKKRCKKTLLYGGMFMVINILFAACTGEVKETVLSDLTPTATVAVTQPSVSTQATSTITPTKDLEQISSPTEEQKQDITPTPSEIPTVIPTVVQTPTPVPTVTPTSVPTATPVPTATLVPTATPTIRVTPTPSVDPLTLVYEGWQQVTEPSGQYTIVFPELYDTVSLEKQSDFFKYVYTASAVPDIKWDLCFYTEETVELRQKKIIEQYPEVKIRLQADGFAYYAETETVFVAGEVYTWNYETAGIYGVMHVETSYPQEKKEEYQREIYNWYVCTLKEE